MIRYTTPTLILTIDDVDLTSCDVYVTLRQDTTKLTISDAEVTYADSKTTINVYLTQTESAKFFVKKPCKLQVNWITSDGVRSATRIKEVSIYENLLTEEITYGE